MAFALNPLVHLRTTYDREANLALAYDFVVIAGPYRNVASRSPMPTMKPSTLIRVFGAIGARW